MKKLIFILFFYTFTVFAQDTTVIVTRNYYHDSLTVTRDTVDIQLPDYLGIVYVSISCYGTSGVDTIQVYTKSLDNWLWCQQRVTDVINDSTSTYIIVNATAKEYYITHDVQPRYIRFIMPDAVLASKIYFTVNGKKEGL
jgi:hypothetical protein